MTKRIRATLAASVLAVALTAVAAAGASTSAYAITGVAFSGSPAAPTITITGSHFGTAPAGSSNEVTSCGDYGTENGDGFGNRLWFLDDTNDWQAGFGTPPNANCIGIKIVSWTSKKAVLQFGVAYGSFDHWTADPGDNFVIKLKNFYWGGVVAYS
jgi:hypothetical protein